MKIIDILNKIAKGEEVPKKIKYKYKKFEFIGGAYEDEKGNDLCYYDDSCMRFLNDEVEIIEEDNKKKKIKELNNVGNSEDLGEFKDKQQLNNHILKDKINELIDEINALELIDEVNKLKENK